MWALNFATTEILPACEHFLDVLGGEEGLCSFYGRMGYSNSNMKRVANPKYDGASSKLISNYQWKGLINYLIWLQGPIPKFW